MKERVKVEKRIINDCRGEIYPIWDFIVKDDFGIWRSEIIWFDEKEIPEKYKKYIIEK